MLNLNGNVNGVSRDLAARLVFHSDGRLQAALFASSSPVAVACDHLANRLNMPDTMALAGRPRADVPDPGATVCVCLNVGINAIR